MFSSIELPQNLLDQLATRFKIETYEAHLKNHPDSIEVLMELGNLYTAAGRYEDGLKIDLRLVKLLPDDPVVYYNLACSYSLLNRTTEALEILFHAINLGFSDIELLLKDEDLKNLRATPEFRMLLSYYFKNKQKK
ncbi:MAG: hypothetical protein N2234_08855 [Planctomycetota bacterium]|nr:hypothetical protein [Planctomycetota bacterium]